MGNINKLRDIRLEKKLSLSAVALMIKKNECSISAIERGLQEATLEDAVRLANVYGKTLDEIYIATKEESQLSK